MPDHDILVECVIKYRPVWETEKILSEKLTAFVQDGFKILSIEEYSSCFIITLHG